MDHHTSGEQGTPTRARMLALTVGAIGVVYGDIGTSPLYSLKECFSPHYHLTPGRPEVLGILSLIFWALTLIICVKYLLIITRFDNKGEGGILALMELVSERKGSFAKMGAIFAMGIFGAALLYGDGIITPAISVLSAVEGLEVAAPGLHPWIIPITIVLLLVLFGIQKYGTGGVGRIFGPFMVGWFALLGALGVISAMQTPDVFNAINPVYGVQFFMDHGFGAFVVLGSVFLVVTGGEALYADMGHFGRTPITRGWFYVAYPGLILQYFGQGALLLREGDVASTVSNPFFHMVPSWGVLPLVLVSTIATIIASQAVISGAYSLTWQALQLGYLPRLKVMHTSSDERGQIYMPTVNWVLFISCVVLVIAFRSSGALAAAYGIAVTSTMVITTILAWFAMRRLFNWGFAPAFAVTSVFLIVDASFLLANMLKFLDGGYVPVAMAAATFLVMITWHKGREILRHVIEKRNKPIFDIIHEEIDRYEDVPGTALYMSGYVGIAPPALISNLMYNRVRHETIVLLSVNVKTASRVPFSQRIEVKPMEKGVYQVVLSYGFMDQLDLMHDLMYLPEYDIPVDITDAIFVLGHETLTVKDSEGMARWRKEIFVFLHRNSRTPARYFGIPVKRTLEVGSHVAI
ncbi:MAG: potassium transporter Kup [Ignavibacteria bacterium]|nr:potassium transporter Kup [Ignavibacteria bacterium]MBP6510313.1 potassium transporter Kup [Candidatus Kapabacteria bacterium]MBK6419648.1 potassium transporter Kup [Ignavibacteria bacterium]MBK7033088.1 potassium transporter Kup [Ignavibacteria bacterium]MBK7184611.1 potassium transporter Kup [Ignavibacteria bacterium]